MNRYLVEFSIVFLLLERKKTLFLFSVLLVVVFMLASVLFVASSLEHIQTKAIEQTGDIVLSREVAGRVTPLGMKQCYRVLDIDGVSGITPRVWGLYKFNKGGVYFSIIGLDRFDYAFRSELKTVAKLQGEKLAKGMIVGRGAKKVLDEAYYSEYLNFLLPDAKVKRIPILGVFDSTTQMLSNDTLLMGIENAKAIVGLGEDEVSDCVVRVKNSDEVATVATKIKLLDPTLRVQTKEELLQYFQNIYDLKSGFFLILFGVGIFTYFMIVLNTISTVSSQVKKEIAILKAIGWGVDTIIKQKLFESFLLASFAYVVGITLALWYVYVLDAPFVRLIFQGYDTLRVPFELPYCSAVGEYMLVFFLSVVVYMGAVLIPTWRIATQDVDEVLR